MYLNLISHVSCVDLCIYRLWIWKGVKRTYTRLSKSYLILLSADNVITKIPIKTHVTIEYRLTGSTYNFFLEQQQQDSGPILISSIITKLRKWLCVKKKLKSLTFYVRNILLLFCQLNLLFSWLRVDWVGSRGLL